MMAKSNASMANSKSFRWRNNIGPARETIGASPIFARAFV